jgi:hypothetical protein
VKNRGCSQHSFAPAIAVSRLLKLMVLLELIWKIFIAITKTLEYVVNILFDRLLSWEDVNY